MQDKQTDKNQWKCKRTKIHKKKEKQNKNQRHKSAVSIYSLNRKTRVYVFNRILAKKKKPPRTIRIRKHTPSMITHIYMVYWYVGVVICCLEKKTLKENIQLQQTRFIEYAILEWIDSFNSPSMLIVRIITFPTLNFSSQKKTKQNKKAENSAKNIMKFSNHEKILKEIVRLKDEKNKIDANRK